MSGSNKVNYQQMMKQLGNMTSGGNMKELLESYGGEEALKNLGGMGGGPKLKKNKK
jgi:hypothetical protein